MADRVVVNTGLATSSIPEFVTAAVLMSIFCVHWKLGQVFADPPPGTSVIGQLPYLLTPALAMVVAYFGYIARMSRAGVIYGLQADYARTATMKGLSKGQVMRKHILRNCAGADHHRHQRAGRIPVRRHHRCREGVQLSRPRLDHVQRAPPTTTSRCCRAPCSSSASSTCSRRCSPTCSSHFSTRESDWRHHDERSTSPDAADRRSACRRGVPNLVTATSLRSTRRRSN